jgi:hypothetical protein
VATETSQQILGNSLYQRKQESEGVPLRAEKVEGGGCRNQLLYKRAQLLWMDEIPGIGEKRNW